MGGAGQSAGTARLAESLALQLLALTQAVLHLREELLHLRLDVVKHLGGQAVDGLQNCLEARLGQHEALEVAALLRPDGRDVVGEGVRRLVHARSHLQDKLLDGLCRGEHVSRLGGDTLAGVDTLAEARLRAPACQATAASSPNGRAASSRGPSACKAA